MGRDSFVHLHVHTEYSMLDGASRIGDLFSHVAQDDQPAVAITDHGNLFGLVEFFNAGQAAGVKPILGSELYQAIGSRRDQQLGGSDGRQRYYHLTVLAHSDTGYRNLIELSTRAYLEGYWYKPRIDTELLAAHNEGLVVLSGCLGSEVNQQLLKGDEAAARRVLSDHKDILGAERFFVELQDHGIPEQRRTWPVLEKLARELGLRTVITNDSHYTEAADAEAHDVLLCIQTGSKITDADRFKFQGDDFYVKTAKEMREAFHQYPDALDATLDIAEMCDTTIEFDLDLLPAFPVPDGMTEAQFLRHKVEQGARERYGSPIPDTVQERIDYELGVIEQMGFPAYFLIVADLCEHARSVGIRVGPGRGSAGGSVVAYCTDITRVDPIRHGLIFERFLNPARIQMPDIDIDFDDRRRGEMIRYAADRYGADHVAQVITFGTIKAKSAIRDAARVLDEPFSVGDTLAKMMPPPVQGKEAPLAEAYEKSVELRQAREDPGYAKVLETAEKLEGLKRQHGIHAAAVIIGAKPLHETLPLLRTDNGEIVTQWEMNAAEALGLLKMDFLGLRNLTVLSDAERHVRTNRGVDIDLDDPAVLGDMDDPTTYEMLGTGHTLGVFQLDSTGMQALVRKLKPTRFEDISALLALYRPGPLSMDMHVAYADRKNGLEAVAYDHPDLEPILGDTFGVCVAGSTLVTDVESGERFRVDETEDRTFLVQGAHGERGKVTRWVDSGVKDTLTLATRSGRSVTLTPDHRVLTPDGWRPAGELRVGDAVATPERHRVDGVEKDQDRLRTLGYLLADGCVSGPSQISFHNVDDLLLDDFEVRVGAAFPGCVTRRYVRARSTQVNVYDDGSGDYRRASSLLTFLREQGVQGNNSATKSIPGEVWGADAPGLATFLAAYWDCDGYVGEGFAYVKTISPHLAHGIKDLLDRLGIPARISSYRQEHCRDGLAYQVHVYDSVSFWTVQSRMLSRKGDVSFVTRSRLGEYDRATVLDALARTGLSQREIERRSGIPRRTVFGTDERWVAERVARQLDDSLDLGLDFRDRWEAIVGIEPAGPQRVYDLTVEGIHSFVADGIVVHNCVYQEQVMKIATDVAGFAMSDADGLRKAVGKKKRDLMESFKDQFVSGGAGRGYEPSLMTSLWGLIEKFAEYGFNKSHTVAYGVVSYQTAYLKAHYPVEYMAALLTSVKNHKDNKPLYLNECRRLGIPVLPPDVNESEADFTPRGDEILFGLSAVRGVGEGIVEQIVTARREHGRFEDFKDFCAKVEGSVLNKRTLENLILAGAFRSLDHPRKGLFATYEPLVDAALTRKKAQAAGQFSLFDGGDGDDGLDVEDGPAIPDEEFDKADLLRHEREMLGLYVSDHPLFGTERVLEQHTDASCIELREKDDGASVTIGGVLTALVKKFTKKGDAYLVATLEDLSGNVEVTFWPNTYRVAHEVLREDEVLVITGRVERRDEAVKVLANKVSAPDLSEALGAPVTVNFDVAQCTAEAVTRLKEVLGHHPGTVAVQLRIRQPDGGVRLYRLSDDLRVERRPGLFGEVKSTFGPDAVDDEVGDRVFGDEEHEPRWKRAG